jgi:hypothetical protein
MRIPVLLADLRRLVIDRVLPYSNTKHFIPNPVRRHLEVKRIDIIFKGRVSMAFEAWYLCIEHELAAYHENGNIGTEDGLSYCHVWWNLSAAN